MGKNDLYRLKSKVWLEKDGVKVFGDGPLDILARVQRTGSLKGAATEIDMSYNQAWRLIMAMEKNLGFPLLYRQAGGERGGGSVLTEEGRELVRRFGDFRRELTELQEKLFNRYFDKGSLFK
ncbi:MAG TPA: LysR family transcriptional regulator [Firmicutes bacterium]|nr:LysR family transcriptional regulator [Bacillota bacterium]